jgi:hypothetical protein
MVTPLARRRPATLRQQAGKDAAEPYDVVAALPPGNDPTPYAEAGATWWLVAFPWGSVSVDQVRGEINAGPVRPWLSIF